MGDDLLGMFATTYEQILMIHINNPSIIFRNALIIQHIWPIFLISASFVISEKISPWLSSDVTTSVLYILPHALDNRPFFLLCELKLYQNVVFLLFIASPSAQEKKEASPPY